MLPTSNASSLPTLTNTIGFVFAASLTVMGAQAAADDIPITSSHTLGYARDAQLMNDDGTQRTGLTFAPYLQSQWQSVQPLTDSSRLTYEGGLEVTGLDDVETDLNASVTYQRNFGDRNAWQWRVTGTADRSLSEGTWTFQRERLTFRLQKRHSPEHTTSGRVRLGYRDQNEATFDGYDQTETLLELTHAWRPNRDRMALSGTIYAEARRADFDRFSYDEAGLRAMFRVPVSDATEITARASYYQRDFQDGFSASNPTIRNDERVRLTVELNHEFTDKVAGKIWMGLDDNTSTIAERDYEGSTIGISTTFTFD